MGTFGKITLEKIYIFRNQYHSMYLETGNRIKFNSYSIVYVDSHTKFGSLSPGQSWLLQGSQPSSRDILRQVESFESTHASSLAGPQFRLILIAHNFLLINFIIPASLVLLQKLYIFSPTNCLGQCDNGYICWPTTICLFMSSQTNSST